MSATALLTRRRLARLTSLATTQLVVQSIGFVTGILLIRHIEQSEYGYYTLAVSMASVGTILTDLGLATAVLSTGGPLTAQRPELGSLVADAIALLRRTLVFSLGLLLPCFAWVLFRQGAAAPQVAALVILTLATIAFNARAGIAMSVTRLLGHVGTQQRLDLAINSAKLVIIATAATFLLDSSVACLVNLAAAIVLASALRRHLHGHVVVPRRPPERYQPSLRAQMWKLAPNSIYFVVNGQLALWLLGIFGNVDRVAEVGALGRLGAIFVVIGTVFAALVMPFFAREESPSAVEAAFLSLNGFFAAVLALLLAIASLFPSTLLWVLGARYGHLDEELAWMIAASTLTAWGGAVYGAGCARGWVLPLPLVMSSGLLSTFGAAALVDVTTVRGSLQIGVATALVSLLCAVGYLVWRSRRHAATVSAKPASNPLR